MAQERGWTTPVPHDLTIHRDDPDPTEFARNRRFLNLVYQRMMWSASITLHGERLAERAVALEATIARAYALDRVAIPDATQ